MATPRDIPSVEQLRQRGESAVLERQYGREALTGALRAAADQLRSRLDVPRNAGEPEPAELPADREDAGAWIIRRAASSLASLTASLRPVINATGVIVHTNLGRAPLARAALDAIARVGGGYSNLEYDLERGERGRRDVHAERLLCRLTGAEAAVVVNNNAAATMLLLAALARGREVIVSRGELVEIGGGFRVPDVMAQSGAILREVGTTNRTRVSDYAAAVGPRTALILRVHPSNFRIEGFTERPALEALVALGRELGVPVAEDQGSGNLLALGGLVDAAGDHPFAPPRVDEPTVTASLAAGADLVCASGDKLLGGPQAGLVLGRREAVDLLRRHPLMRACRVDKLTYSALEATLLEYAAGRATSTVPVAAMAAMPAAAIRGRAEALCERVARGGIGTTRDTTHDTAAGADAADAAQTPLALTLAIEPGVSTIGGGSAPGSSLPTWLVAIRSDDAGADTIEAALRASDPPVVARIADRRVLLDLRTVLPEQDAILARTIADLARRGHGA